MVGVDLSYTACPNQSAKAKWGTEVKKVLAKLTETIQADLIIVPAIGGPSGSEYLALATAMTAAAANIDGLALLDPPTAVVQQAAADPATHDPALVALAEQIRGAVSSLANAALYSSPMVGPSTYGETPASVAAATVIAQNDADVGTWGRSGWHACRAAGEATSSVVDQFGRFAQCRGREPADAPGGRAGDLGCPHALHATSLAVHRQQPNAQDDPQNDPAGLNELCLPAQHGRHLPVGSQLRPGSRLRRSWHLTVL